MLLKGPTKVNFMVLPSLGFLLIGVLLLTLANTMHWLSWTELWADPRNWS